jgi:hypothetical protein
LRKAQILALFIFEQLRMVNMYIEPDVIAELKKIDLLTYMQVCEPDNLVKLSEAVYSTKEHDSLKISNGKWQWWSRGTGGANALKYLIDVKGMRFLEAAETLLNMTASQPEYPGRKDAPPVSPKKLLLPPRNTDDIGLRHYLLSRRGIDKEIINCFIDAGKMYESNADAIVFVGYDKSGTARHASMRGIHSDFKGEAKGSDKRFTFSVTAEKHSDVLHVFEGVIDLLSYATITKLSGRDFRQENMLSLCGVSAGSDSPLPLPLREYTGSAPFIKTIALHLDNDGAGTEAAHCLVKKITEAGLTALNEPPPEGKDMNDFLIAGLQNHYWDSETHRANPSGCER